MKRLIACLFALAFAVPAAASNGISESGLHWEDWFSLTFRDIAEDLDTANEAGKRLVYIVEQVNCAYCKELHEKVLSDDEVSGYIKDNFMVVQLNLFGIEDVTDFDGEVMKEREMTRRWGVLFTPTVIFMPEEAPEDGATAAQAAVALMPGAFGKLTTLHMFQWVREKGYETDEPFQSYHIRKFNERRSN